MDLVQPCRTVLSATAQRHASTGINMLLFVPRVVAANLLHNLQSNRRRP